MDPNDGELTPEAAAALGIEEGESRSLRSSARFLAGLAMLWIIGAVGAALWPAPEIPEIHHLDNAELSLESSYILAAYRDGQGSGDRFVGRLDSDWSTLEASDRYEQAEEIVEGLAARGVADLMLFDDDMSLQVHFVDGQLRTPTRPQESDDSETS